MHGDKRDWRIQHCLCPLYLSIEFWRSGTGHETEAVLFLRVFKLCDLPFVAEEEHRSPPAVLRLEAAEQLAVLLGLIDGLPAALCPPRDLQFWGERRMLANQRNARWCVR